MTDKAVNGNGADQEFLNVLKQGVRDALKNKRCKQSERVAAITAGAKLLVIERNLNESLEKGFFD